VTLPGESAGRQHGLRKHTELAGQPFALDTHAIIRHRYALAAELAAGRRVLEIGAGGGLGLSWLARNARTMVAGEYAAANIAGLRPRRPAGVNLVRMDAAAMPFAERSFDLCVALAMIYYVELPKFLREAHRVLDGGGRLFFCSSNKDVPGFWAAPLTTRYYSVPELDDILRRHGFEPTFEAAFPLPGSFAMRRARALVKDVAKLAVLCLPRGRDIWERLRAHSQAEGFPLPEDIETAGPGEPQLEPIGARRRDRTHRVVYVTAVRR